MNKNLIQQLCDLNWSKLPNGYPKLVYSNIGDRNISELADALSKIGSVDMLTPDRDMENKVRQILDLPDLPDDIYDNYEGRTTAQSKALPLTQLGPAQNPEQPLPTGQVKENPPTGHNKPGNKLPGDQTNRLTRTNERKDSANQPTPEANTYATLRTRNAKMSDAVADLAAYRRELMARIMADEADTVVA